MAQCTATSKQTGRPCQAGAVPGATVCRHHGGASPQVKAAAARRLLEADAVKAMRRFGEPIDTTPTEALLDAVRWTAGYVAWLREKVADVENDQQLVWGMTRRKTAVDTTDDDLDGKRRFAGNDEGDTHEAKPNAWLVLLGEWHDKLVKICAEAIRCNIDERMVRVAEAQGALFAEVIRGILDDLQLTDDQQQLVPEIVPRHLRKVAG